MTGTRPVVVGWFVSFCDWLLAFAFIRRPVPVQVLRLCCTVVIVVTTWTRSYVKNNLDTPFLFDCRVLSAWMSFECCSCEILTLQCSQISDRRSLAAGRLWSETFEPCAWWRYLDETITRPFVGQRLTYRKIHSLRRKEKRSWAPQFDGFLWHWFTKINIWK